MIKYPVSPKQVNTFGGLWNKDNKADVQTKMFIYQSKANLDGKISFGKITHHLDPEIRKMLVTGKVGDKDSMFHSSL